MILLGVIRVVGVGLAAVPRGLGEGLNFGGSDAMTSVLCFLDSSHMNAGGPLIQCVFHHQFHEWGSWSGNSLMILMACAYFSSIFCPSGLLMS